MTAEEEQSDDSVIAESVVAALGFEPTRPLTDDELNDAPSTESVDAIVDDLLADDDATDDLADLDDGPDAVDATDGLTQPEVEAQADPEAVVDADGAPVEPVAVEDGAVDDADEIDGAVDATSVEVDADDVEARPVDTELDVVVLDDVESADAVIDLDAGTDEVVDAEVDSDDVDVPSVEADASDDAGRELADPETPETVDAVDVESGTDQTVVSVDGDAIGEGFSPALDAAVADPADADLDDLIDGASESDDDVPELELDGHGTDDLFPDLPGPLDEASPAEELDATTVVSPSELGPFDAPVDAPLVDSAPVAATAAAAAAEPAPRRFARRRRLRARKVRRVVRHIDPWSVLTFSVLFHLALFTALLLAGVLLWNAAVRAGTVESIESFIEDIGDYEAFEIDSAQIFRSAVIIGATLTLASSVLLVLLTVVFNLISDLIGGIRVTVIEEETVQLRPKRRRRGRPRTPA